MAALFLLIALVLLVLLPLLFGELMLASLAKLHLSPEIALALVLAILLGSVVNLPVRRVTKHEDLPAHPLAVFGVADLLPQFRRRRRQTVIAVNVGGCVIPVGLAAYETAHLAAAGLGPLAAAAVASLANVAVCYLLARPVPGVGIAIPGLVPGFVAAMLALLLAPFDAAPIAYIAGIAGPLVGADLLHLKDITKTSAAVVSIGGAGTFDGIILSGVLAAYLA